MGNSSSGSPQGSQNFGNGEVGGDRSYTSPVYGQTADGHDVTVSFGQGSRDGHTLISDGHVSGSQFYGAGGHDHYGPNGETGSNGDRGAYTGK